MEKLTKDSPANWCKHYPVANGQRQSPVDLKKSDVLFDPKLKGTNFEFHYLPQDCHELLNKGHTWSIKAFLLYVTVSTSLDLNASHLPWEYKLVDIHCHWGRDSKYGSEHTVNGRAYSAEIHIVHMNKKYSSFEEALRYGDGLAVLGIFLEILLETSRSESDHGNKALDTLVNSIKSIQYKNDKVLLPKGLDVKGLIADDLNFWTYDGSLTTPPCCECVIWTVFRTPIQISKAQIQVFRHLCQVCKNESQNLCCLGSENGNKIVNNYRPTQPIHGRRIRSSFE
uniref:Carbonic anhydrase n=1 Tax=Romanomermis culicivorax TaxID=13658 RepID=A0A915JEP1_ROMCU